MIERSRHESTPGPGRTAPGGWDAGCFSWLLLAAVALVGWALLTWAVPTFEAPLPIGYSTLLAEVRAGRVAAVTLAGQQATGAFTGARTLVGDALLGPDEPVPPPDPARPARSGGAFTTTLPEGASAHLLPLLEQHGVATRAEAGRADWWPALLLTLLPLALIIGLMVFAWRGLAGAAEQQQRDVAGFGRSRARVADPGRPGATFADVAGEEEAKADLGQVVDFLRRPDKYRRLGARLPRGVLLVGPPGTGKTLLARAVAGEASVPFFSISASEFVELFVGVGASRVRDLFAQAKAAAPAIIFVDELDAVGRQRFAGVGGGHDEREQTLNQLLTEMDGFEPHEAVIVLAATNRPDVLDAALLRPGRFDRQVALGLPDRRGRAAILRLHARDVPLAATADLDALAAATPGCSGADLANLVNEAALLAARADQATVEPADLEAALDRLLLGAERPLLMTAPEKRLIAYHEAGHALVAHLTPGADPVRKISIVPRGQALGVTVQAPAQDRFTYGRAELGGRLAALLGGRAAERLVYGEMTNGAQNDLKAATELARQMVGLWEMSEEIGPLFLGLGERHVFLGRELTQEPGVGAALLDRADAAIGRLLDEAEARAAELLRERHDALDRLAEALVDEETLDEAAIRAVIGAPMEPATPANARAGARAGGGRQ